jgi:hydrogenase maturation protease
MMATSQDGGAEVVPVLIIGVGNPYRRDDGVGITIARRLKGEIVGSIVVREESGEGAALLAAWGGAEHVILLDAVSSGAEAGTIFRFDAAKQPIPAPHFRHSTHAIGVAEAIELARTLGQLPPSLVVYGVEGAEFTAGTGLSAAVERAAARVADAVRAEIRATPSTGQE